MATKYFVITTGASHKHTIRRTYISYSAAYTAFLNCIQSIRSNGIRTVALTQSTIEDNGDGVYSTLQSVVYSDNTPAKITHRECDECGTVLTSKEWRKGELCPVCYPYGHKDI